MFLSDIILNLKSINWFFYSSISLCLSNAYLLILLLCYGKTEVHKKLFIFYIPLFIWALFSLLISITSNPLISLVYWKLGCVSVTFTSVLSLQVTFCVINKKERISTFLSYLQAAFFASTIILTEWTIAPPLKNPYGHFWLVTPGPLYFWWFSAWVIVLAYTHISIFREHKNKNSTPLSIKEMNLFYATGFASGVFNFFNPFNFYAFQFANFGMALYVLALTCALVKNQNIPLEIAYRKGLLYSTMAAIITGLYFIFTYIIEAIFKNLIGYKSFLFSIVFAFVIASIFDPARKIVHGIVDKVFLGKLPQEALKENELLKQALERSERLKTTNTLALGLAHEIRNPLTTLKTFAQYLPKKYHDKEFIDQFSGLVTREVERINNIVTKLLNFSKPTTPKIERINASGYISDIVNLMSSELLNKHIILSETSIDPELYIYADPNQFKQVIWNLIVNSLQAMPGGGCLKISARQENDLFALVCIQDDGIGIPKDKIKNIFDPFYTTKDDGTGLGLAIVHQIVESHKGKIQVESTQGQGATFRIFWPMRQA